MGFLHEIFVNGERSQLSNRCRHGGAVPVPFMGPDLDTGTFTFTFIDFETNQGARVPGLTLQGGWAVPAQLRSELPRSELPFAHCAPI